MRLNTNKTGSTTLTEWTTPDCRNTPSTTDLEEEETVDAPGKDGNASKPEQVKRPNPWRKTTMMMMMMMIYTHRGSSAKARTAKRTTTQANKNRIIKKIKLNF